MNKEEILEELGNIYQTFNISDETEGVEQLLELINKLEKEV